MAVPRNMVVQSLLFCPLKFTAATAKRWASEHGYNTDKVDRSGNYIRLRQLDPKLFQEKTFRTISFTKAIKAIVGRPWIDLKGLDMMKKKTKKHASVKKHVKHAKKHASVKKHVKRATKKHAEPKHAKTSAAKGVKIVVEKHGGFIGSSGALWHAYLIIGGKTEFVGHVNAANQTDAKRKARSFIRRGL